MKKIIILLLLTTITLLGQEALVKKLLVCGWAGCHKTFAHQNGLNAHMQIHTKIKPYQCDECGKFFTQKYNLKTHQQTIHSGERLLNSILD